MQILKVKPNDLNNNKSFYLMYISPLPAAYNIVCRHTTEVVQHPLAGALPVVYTEICL